MGRSDGSTPAPTVIAIVVIPAIAWPAGAETLMITIAVVVGARTTMIYSVMWTARWGTMIGVSARATMSAARIAARACVTAT